MAQTLASLQRKIKIAKELREVVETMKTMAAVNIGIYEKVDRSLAEYNQVIELAIGVALAKYQTKQLPGTRSDASDGVGIVVFGTDQGMVGQFNDCLSNVVLEAAAAASGHVAVWSVGERVGMKLAEELPVQRLYRVPDSAAGITALAGRILVDVVAHQEQTGIGKLMVCYNKSNSSAGYEPFIKQLLPVSCEWLAQLAKRTWPTKMLPQVIEKNAEALAAFIRESLFINMCWACSESLVSENVGRLTAMQRAEKNIDALLDDFIVTYNQERQSSITEELFDVIFGYDLLKNVDN